MSTRGAIGFRIDGTDKVTYNHSDSYPEYLGNIMVQFIKDTPADELRTVAERLELVDEDTPPTTEQIAYYRGLRTVNLGVSTQDEHEWYCLLRNAQGEPNAWKNGVRHMPDNAAFLTDSLFCEWAYIVNLDEEMLEVYKGFNKNRNAPGRYAALAEEDEDYAGVALIDEVSLDDVRTADTDSLVAKWENA